LNNIPGEGTEGKEIPFVHPVKNTLTFQDFSVYLQTKERHSTQHKAPKHHYLLILIAVQIQIPFTCICEVNISLLFEVSYPAQ
jgi:hypothetical protein